jgi:catechol 2,3-dioxygenase
MDAPNPSAIPTAASRAPIHIGAVGVIVRDLGRVTAYYRDMLGLTVQEHTPQVATLGVGGVALLELSHRPDAMLDDPREAGLYHTAFLMPTRADLARWILHAAKGRVPFNGASDHGVSEAIYLDDPEGQRSRSLFRPAAREVAARR